MTKRVAVITGASAGLGVEFARQLSVSEKLDEIWLVARRAERLENLASEIGREKCRVIVADLRTPQGVTALCALLDAEKPELRWLINNAGFGKFGWFSEISMEDNHGMIDLNITALTEITFRSLPYCASGARIVQVASAAGFTPMPAFSVYAATKAYVVSLSHALAYELKARGISVTAVCPGPVDTEFFAIAGNGVPRKKKTASPELVVALALADSRAGKLTSTYSLPIRAFVKLSGVLPTQMKLAGAFRRKKAELDEIARKS